MKFKFNFKVFWLKGKSGSSCIYDLRSEFAEIYHLNSMATKYIDELLDAKVAVEIDYAHQLIEN